MKSKDSRFIVLEGLDGTGKSTQVKMLRHFFDAQNVSTHYVHFPRTDETSPVFGPMVAKFLRGDYGPLEQVHPELVALIYAGDRFNAAHELNNMLAEGKHIIADRYVFSNIGFQCAKLADKTKRKELIMNIFEMEYHFFQIPQPDLSVFLHVPIAFVEQQLKAEREGEERNYLQGKEDIHEQSIDFQKAVEQVYLDVCEMMPDKLHYLNCMSPEGNMMSPEEIHEKIVSLLNERQLI
jgi:dTMP kinase